MKGKLVPVTSRGHVLGEQHHRAKLSDDDVRLILALRAEGVPQHQVAEKFDCSRRTVRDIEAGRTRGGAPDRWRRPNGPPTRTARERILASRWPSRIRPAKAEEFDVIPQSETAGTPLPAVSENAS